MVISGCELRASYRAAGRANETGGDFYDLFRAGDRHMLVVGDMARGKDQGRRRSHRFVATPFGAAALQIEEPALPYCWIS